MSNPTSNPKRSSRQKPAEITTVRESAPWILLTKAAEQSGLTVLLIRKAGLKLRRFGNADYVAPASLNAYILCAPPTAQQLTNRGGLQP